MEPNHILETKNLRIGYGKGPSQKVVGSAISVNAGLGELVGIIGVNGVGKSTFLRTVSGIQAPLEGEVWLQNRRKEELAPEELARLISLVLTQQSFSRNLRVEELIALGRQPYTNWIGRMSTEDRQQVDRALHLSGMEAFRTRKCHELSDGQLQKVMIARALAQDTPLMILDEPTSHLDMYHKAQVLKLLRDLSQQTDKAVLFATHEINLALQLCDRLILMTPKAVLQGTSEELITAQALQDLFPKDLIYFDPSSQSFRIKS